MAGKKPAKVNSSNKKEKTQLPGKALMYIAPKGAQAYVCPTCKRSLTKGIIYEVDSQSFCNRRCIPKTQTQEVVA